MAKYAVVVMSEHSQGNPGGQGRMLHALSAAQGFRDAGEEVSIWFHGVEVTWPAAFNAQYDQFTRHYGSLFDSLRGSIGGACDICTRTGSAQLRQHNSSACPSSVATATTTTPWQR